jgi:hypothetical protein
VAKLTDFLKRGEPDSGTVAQVLARLNESQDTVRVEVEVTCQHFLSKVRLRSGAVVLTCPQGVETHLKEGGWLRIRLPSNGRKDLRLQVTQARYGGSGEMATQIGRLALLCKIPGATVEAPKRAADRVRTDRFRGVVLQIPTLPAPYRIIDLSLNGWKIRPRGEEDQENFPLGSYLERGSILLGKRARVDLQDVIPRHYMPEAIGLEIIVQPSGRSRKLLEVFLEHMLTQELKEPEVQGSAARQQAPAEKPG